LRKNEEMKEFKRKRGREGSGMQYVRVKQRKYDVLFPKRRNYSSLSLFKGVLF